MSITLREKIEIMSAAESGAKIEIKTKLSNELWWYSDTDRLEWNWGTHEFRVKREPIVRYAVTDLTGGLMVRTYSTRERAEEYIRRNVVEVTRAKVIKLVEEEVR